MTLKAIKDKIALEQYSCPLWIFLSEHQRAMLVDQVALEFALSEIEGVKEDMKRAWEAQDAIMDQGTMTVVANFEMGMQTVPVDDRKIVEL